MHWINAGFVNIAHLAKVKKPIVWTIRDMWPMTGGCHHAMNCERYKAACGKCEQLSSDFKYDLSFHILKRKKRHLPKTVKIVGISNWIRDCAKESSLFRGSDVRTIHNNVNTADFFPIEKQRAREALGIRTKKKIILAGTQSWQDVYKGFDKYLEAVKSLSRERYFLALFGKLQGDDIDKLGFEYHNFGFLSDAIALRLLYSSADVFISPSLVEAFGKTLAEAMACGTPAVCFDATGHKDVVDHRVTGYRATPFDANDLANGINWVVANEARWQELSRNSCRKVMAEFDSKVVAQRYIELYDELLAN